MSTPPRIAPAPKTTTVELLESGEAAFPRMLAAIATAMWEIHLEMYGLSAVGIGAEFIAALIDAHNRGVKVLVEIDAWGSRPYTGRVEEELKRGGIDVKVYNPLLNGFIGRFRRNHRKILLVDNEVAFFGGINLNDSFIGKDGWADLAVELRGAACEELGLRMKNLPATHSDPNVQFFLSGARGGRKLRDRYIQAIRDTRTHLYMAHSYFLPDRRTLRAILHAAARGVEVILLTPGRSDVALARAATILLYERLIKGGVKVYEWTESVLHAKVAVTDDDRLLVGSFNLDPYSLANLEVLVEAHDASAASHARTWIAERVFKSKRITDYPRQNKIKGLIAFALGRLGGFLAHFFARLFQRG